jgi:hypothetical protein
MSVYYMVAPWKIVFAVVTAFLIGVGVGVML